ncbi:hypothetical protein F441_15490 [Phytophthora nicotianae CJ01A1]|uniref:Uncharacterized protein n=1 Tax=Phytophthora nicotianae CJ01A1 TaxID=1317063 RepID=W2WEU0_PHYNI|nr:hypothetical protein F441_15490 [Phytophthora nicotianae CJ01A1]
MQHVRREHPDYAAVMLEATTAQTGSLVNYVRHSAFNLHAWMSWTITCNLPLSFCESRETRRYSNLDPISQETLPDAMDGVIVAVERSIVSEIPTRFGLMLDGWTHVSEQYITVFACYEVNGSPKTPLLSMAPLLDAPDDDLSAQRHLDFLADMLLRDFGGTAGAVSVLCCQQLLRKPTASKSDGNSASSSGTHELRTVTQSAKLRLKTALRPVIRQDTRWSSTFEMVRRYFKLLEFLDADDDEIMEILPLPAANKRLRTLHQELRDIESVVKALQGHDVDLLDVREWFDELIAAKPQYARYIVQRLRLAAAGFFVAVLHAFEAPQQDNETVNADEGGETESFVERVQKRRRLAKDCVRVARVTFGHQRHGHLPRTLETFFFLRENRTYWDATTVDSLH